MESSPGSRKQDRISNASSNSHFVERKGSVFDSAYEQLETIEVDKEDLFFRPVNQEVDNTGRYTSMGRMHNDSVISNPFDEEERDQQENEAKLYEYS